MKPVTHVWSFSFLVLFFCAMTTLPYLRSIRPNSCLPDRPSMKISSISIQFGAWPHWRGGPGWSAGAIYWKGQSFQTRNGLDGNYITFCVQLVSKRDLEKAARAHKLERLFCDRAIDISFFSNRRASGQRVHPDRTTGEKYAECKRRRNTLSAI